MKEHWRELKRSRPGHRFQDRYHRSKAQRANHWSYAVIMGALIVLSIAIGIVLIVMPGPAVVFFFIAASLAASFSLKVARALDALELKVRAWWSRHGRRFVAGWRRRKVTPSPHVRHPDRLR